ncbi:MAG TPA: hypothetical protein VLA09_13600, partial [Longimicrobiales bacterium]|nr:hypothetical protein [Longimicrobiales bacterium]
MPRAAVVMGVVVIVLAALSPRAAASQDWTRREYPLAPPNSKGNFVAPYFDGFYQNEDGTYTLSFGFMNRNDEELIEIPRGPDNFIEPAEFDGGQPTSFPVVSYSGFGGPRERGAFGVVVPADFEGDVWWTLTTDGYTTRVPGRLVSPGPVVRGAYELSTTPMAEGSQRPLIRFTEDGPDGWGIEGLRHPEAFTTRVGEPIEVRLWAFDRGERELGAVNMTLWKHQGPAGSTVAFESLVAAVAGAGGRGGGFNLPDGVTLDDISPEILARFGLGRRGRRPPGPGPVDVGVPIPIPTEGESANL